MVGHSPSPDRPSLWQAAPARCPCLLGHGECRCGDPSPYQQRTLTRVGVVRCGRGTRATAGGRPLPGCGASRVVRSPSASCLPSDNRLGPAAPFPWARGGGRRARHQPHSARSLASWLCALWEQLAGAPGGAPLASFWDVPGWALSHARPPVLGACGRGPLQAGCGCGEGGCGGRSPTPQRALLQASFARCWGSRRAPGQERSCFCAGCAELLASPRPTALPSGVRLGLATHWLRMRGDVGVGTRHRPQSARFSEQVLRAVGSARGQLGGAPLAWVWGVPGWALSRAPPPVLGACGRGPLPTFLRVWAWRRVTNPTTRALASCFCALRGQLQGSQRGRALAWVWGVRGWALSHARPPVLGASGRGPLPTGYGCGGCGRGDPSPTPQRALLRAVFQRCGVSSRAPRGAHLLPECGASGCGSSPTPDTFSFGPAAGARYPRPSVRGM